MNNIMLQLQKNNIDAVLNNDNVIFDETVGMLGSISYDNVTGIIKISENGLYMIDWCIAMQATSGSPSVIFKLITDNGQEYDSNAPNKTGNMSGIAVLNVDDAPVNFSIVNTSSATVFFPNTIISKANLRVFNLSVDTGDNSRCFALDQFANVLEQIVTIYQGASVSVFSTRLASVSGTIGSLYRAPDAGSVPLFILQSGGVPVAISIDKITLLYLPDSVYDDSITYLAPPDPFPQNCDTDLLRNIFNYVAVGDNISIATGPTTTASGDVHVNEYGMIVLADAVSTIFLITPQLFSIVVNVVVGMDGEKPISVSAASE